MGTVPPFSELIAATTRSAAHLETRDAYTPDDPAFLDWRAGRPAAAPAGAAWYDLVREHTARGVEFRRARVVSEPLADYIRFEYESDGVQCRGGRAGPVAAPARRAGPAACRWPTSGCSMTGSCASGSSPATGRSCGMTCATTPRWSGRAPRHSSRSGNGRFLMASTGPPDSPVMAISPSSSVQRAREQLAERLRDIRLDARLTARALSAAAGWHEAKTSRIESAKKAPSEDDIRAWCRVCGAERAIPDLIAASRSADSMYIEWRRLQPAGMRRDQENRLPAARADQAAQGLRRHRRPGLPPDARVRHGAAVGHQGLSRDPRRRRRCRGRPDAAQAPGAVGQPPLCRPPRRGCAAAGHRRCGGHGRAARLPPGGDGASPRCHSG